MSSKSAASAGKLGSWGAGGDLASRAGGGRCKGEGDWATRVSGREGGGGRREGMKGAAEGLKEGAEGLKVNEGALALSLKAEEEDGGGAGAVEEDSTSSHESGSAMT